MSEIPDSSNLFGSLQTELAKAEVAAAFESAGWSIRNSGWEEFELRSEYAELVLEAEKPLLLHGPVADLLENAERIAEVLRGAGVRFSLECYDKDKELMNEITS